MVSSDKDRAEVGKLRSESLSKYTASIGAQDLIPPEIFLREFIGLSETDATIVMQAMEEFQMEMQQKQDQPLSEEEQALMEEENNNQEQEEV